MAFYDRHQILITRIGARAFVILWLLLALLSAGGCGLVLRGLEQLLPEEEVRDVVCDRESIRVGLAAGPYPPFVFPVVETDLGPRVTGLDVELLRAIERELKDRCNKPITPALRLIPFNEMFSLIHEGKLDLFITATPADVAGPGRGGLAYSLPYFIGGGLTPMARNEHIASEISHRLEGSKSANDPFARRDALTGFRKAVVDGSSAAAYAEAQFKDETFIVCDSLLAAFEEGKNEGNEPDLILGSQPVVAFTARRMRPKWKTVAMPNGEPLLLTHEYLSIVVADEKLSLHWFINNLLFRMRESGDLERLRKRWLEDDYEYRERAQAEGLPMQEGARHVQEQRDCYAGHAGFGKLRTLMRE